MEGLQDFNEHQNTCGCISIWFEAGSWKYARYEIFSEQKLSLLGKIKLFFFEKIFDNPPGLT